MRRSLCAYVLDNPHSSLSLKALSQGDLFTLRDYSDLESTPERYVYVRGSYDSSSRTYECYKYGDVSCTRFLRGSTPVFCNFVF